MNDQNKTHGVLNQWLRAERLADVPDVDAALVAFCADPSGDNGTGVIVAVLDAIDE